MAGSTFLGSVYGELVLDISKWNSGIKDAQNALNSFGVNAQKQSEGVSSKVSSIGSVAGGLGSVFLNVGNLARSGFGFVTTAVGQAEMAMNSFRLAGIGIVAGLGLIAKSSIQSASNFEQNRIAFETMLGSADKARDLLKQISDFAVKTPFELPQLVEGSKRLMAYGIEMENIIPTMNMLGNIASGVGMEKLPNLILAFGQVKAATKLTGMELRQFSEAGVPLLEALVNKANETGGALTKMGGASKEVTRKVASLTSSLEDQRWKLNYLAQEGKKGSDQYNNLSDKIRETESRIKSFGSAGEAVYVKVKQTAKDMIDQVSDGNISFQQVQEALMGMTSEGGKFYNLMLRQSTTFGGVISNIRDQLGRMSRQIMGISEGGDITKGSIFDTLRNSAANLFEWLNDNSDNIASAVSGAWNKVSTIFSQLYTNMKPVIDYVIANGDAFIAFIQGFGVAFAGLLVIGKIASVIGFLLTPLGLITMAVGLLFVAWNTNWLGIQQITQTILTNISQFMASTVPNWLDSIAGFATGAIKAFNAISKVVVDFVLPALGMLLEFSSIVFAGMLQMSTNLMGNMVKVIGGGLQTLVKNAMPILKALAIVFANIFMGIVGVVRGAMIAIAGLMTKDWEKVGKGFVTIGASLVTAFVGIGYGMFNAIANGLNKIKNAIVDWAKNALISFALKQMGIKVEKTPDVKTETGGGGSWGGAGAAGIFADTISGFTQMNDNLLSNLNTLDTKIANLDFEKIGNDIIKFGDTSAKSITNLGNSIDEFTFALKPLQISAEAVSNSLTGLADKLRGMSSNVTTPQPTDTSNLASTVNNFNVEIGMYAGTEMEKREIAVSIFNAYNDYLTSKGANA